MKLAFDEIQSPLGILLIAARAGRLCAVDYDDGRDRLMASLAARYETMSLIPTPDPFGFSGILRRYFAGDLHALDAISVETGGTDFQCEVWAAVRRIPPGWTLTYAELARRIDRPQAARAVGSANARNPLSIVIPCHRLVGTSGSLTGYAGGLARKRWLLAHEGAAASVPSEGGRAVPVHQGKNREA
jgi:methylated-DNA-[protein]-cysteine S-methyltransferase